MNKEEFLKTLEGIAITDDYGNEFNGGYEEGLDTAYELAHQLDEPEKVVIPQFVADEFDYEKRTCYQVDESKDIPLILQYAFENPGIDDFLDWVRENPEEYVMAVRSGYEIKKEKKYLVEDNHYALLCKFEGKVISTHKSENDDLPIECLEFELTEKEIKDYDERYWAFAQPVEEEEK